MLQQLLYADEVRSLSDVPLPDGEVREPELKLAKQLIDQIASETFDPTQYHDDVRERIQADIEKKVQGQDITRGRRAERRARPHHRPDGGAEGEPRQGQGGASRRRRAAPRGGRRAEPPHSRRSAQKSADAAPPSRSAPRKRVAEPREARAQAAREPSSSTGARSKSIARSDRTLV